MSGAGASHAAAAVVSILLVAIGAIHLYWAAGGRVGKDAAIPSDAGRPVLSPRPVTTALVGVVLFVAAALVAATAAMVPAFVPNVVLKAASGLLALVFVARALGDFRYVGFFKCVKGSVFAQRDTLFYSPLCLILAALIAVVAVF